MEFAGLTLELQSPLHIGAGRGGMLARSHGFVPGHVLTYALAAAIGKALGGRLEDFAGALEIVLGNLRCGPLLILDENRKALTPRLQRDRIEAGYLIAQNHVTLYHGTRSAVEGALFEVESISPQVLGRFKGRRNPAVCLGGGVWFRERSLADKPVQTWFRHCLLGGELKAGLGRVRLRGWAPGARDYAGRWSADAGGLKIEQDGILPGPTLEGGIGAPLQPWLGRLHDPVQGFGRRFGAVALIRMDACCAAPGRFLPATSETGLGCWVPAHESV